MFSLLTGGRADSVTLMPDRHELDCDVVQGFLFSKSLSASAFEELLIEHRQVVPSNSSLT